MVKSAGPSAADTQTTRRLIYIFAGELPSTMASGVNVAKSCAAFAADGWDVTLVHFRGRGDIFRDYDLSHRFKTLALPIPIHWRGAAALLAWIGAILARFSGAVAYGRKTTALPPAARLGCPVALELHGPVVTEARRSSAAFAALLRSKKLRAIICISQALADHIADEWPDSARLLVVAHDAADSRPASDMSPVRTRDRPLLGYAGHLYPGKGMEIIAALARARPDWDFLVIGGRPQDVALWRNRTDGLANIDLVGMVAHAEVRERLAEADILLAPYARTVIVSDERTDASKWMSPLKLFEYMALAKPIVASDLPVLREVLRDGQNARLARPDDPKDWERVIAELLEQPGQAAEMGARAREELEAKYSWRSRARAIGEAIGLGAAAGDRRRPAGASGREA